MPLDTRRTGASISYRKDVDRIGDIFKGLFKKKKKPAPAPAPAVTEARPEAVLKSEEEQPL